MVTHINSFTFNGIDVVDIDLQVHIASGIPSFTIVGLPDKIVGEARERVRSALTSLGLDMPLKRITLNLAPADLLKEGSHFDLPIACGLLVTMGILPEEELANYHILGELSLDGAIAPVSGILPAAIGANARDKGIICPAGNGSEASWASDELPIIAAPSLLSLINHFKGTQLLSRPSPKIAEEQINFADMDDIKGQELAKRALEIAACGGHNLLMSGPPGAGKSMLASRLISILPEMDAKEMLESSMISSISGNLTSGQLQTKRPFRSPHHSCSMAAMVGGGMGKRVMPGEISLAHNGVLFLDELPEFPRAVLDSLRQPIETGKILVARANSHITYPARFQLIAAMNPCRCGYLSDAERQCNRAPKCAIDYQSKISGPIFDRIDIHIDVPQITTANLNNKNPSEPSKSISERVAKTRYIQKKRFAEHNISTNSEADGKLLLDIAEPDSEGQSMLNEAADKMKLSMRAYHRVLRVARTIADIENEAKVRLPHIAESLSYRQLIIKR